MKYFQFYVIFALYFYVIVSQNSTRNFYIKLVEIGSCLFKPPHLTPIIGIYRHPFSNFVLLSFLRITPAPELSSPLFVLLCSTDSHPNRQYFIKTHIIQNLGKGWSKLQWHMSALLFSYSSTTPSPTTNF